MTHKQKILQLRDRLNALTGFLAEYAKENDIPFEDLLRITQEAIQVGSEVTQTIIDVEVDGLGSELSDVTAQILAEQVMGIGGADKKAISAMAKKLKIKLDAEIKKQPKKRKQEGLIKFKE